MTTPPEFSVMVSGLNRMRGPGIRAGVDCAVHAEANGIEEYLYGDHVVLGGDMTNYPYGQFGYSGAEGEIRPEEPCFPDTLAMLSAAAVSTSRIRLGTGVLLAALRHPVLLAKMVGTIAELADGRLTLGVGTGWLRKEFDALGVPFGKRWTALSDTIRACRVLWEEAPASFASDTVTFDGVYCRPAPPNRVPVWLGAKLTPERAEWVARHGDGWFPLVGDVDEIASGAALLHQAFHRQGRAASDVGVRVYGPEVRDEHGRLDVPASVDAAHALFTAGANTFWYVTYPQPGQMSIDEVRRWIDEIAELRITIRDATR